jgi:hypothetical protein
MLRAAQQHLVPELDPAIHLLVDIIAREHLLLIQPATDAVALECIVDPAGEGFIRVIVTDKARVELDRGPAQPMETPASPSALAKSFPPLLSKNDPPWLI